MLRLGDLRAAVPDACRARDDRRVLRDLLRDALLYAATMAGALLLPWPAGRLAAGVAAGVAVTALFVWAHDAAHGALLGDGRAARVLGELAMLPSLQPFRLWQHGHNRVHHGFTSMVALDWIWRPWSPSEWASASPSQRLGYRVERSFAGCGWHYLRRVWWAGMLRHRPASPRQRRDAWIARAQSAAFAVTAGLVAHRIGGWWSVAAAVVVPWLVFSWAIACITHLHHTHPTRRFHADRSTWDPVAGHVTGSTVLHVPRPLRWLFHDIWIHAPHHLDTKIPYHALAAAWDALRPAAAGLDVLEARLDLAHLRSSFGGCVLYDYDGARWVPYPS